MVNTKDELSAKARAMGLGDLASKRYVREEAIRQKQEAKELKQLEKQVAKALKNSPIRIVSTQRSK